MTIIPIVFSINDCYVPYFTACLMSLQDVANENDTYELFVFNKDVSSANKEILKSSITKNNIVLTFTDISPFIKQKDFKTNIHLTVETFFRFYIPMIFKDRFEKVLYCDSDIVFCSDPSVLFTVPLDNDKLAAARANTMNGKMNGNPKLRQYLTEELALRNPSDYFQTGILLFNVPAITETDITDLEEMACRQKYNTCDQDILNSYYQGRVAFFGSEWNYIPPNEVFSSLVPAMDEDHRKEYIQAGNNPKIIHYASNRKPWFYPDDTLASVWWSYARKTLFYPEILCRLLNYQIEQKYKERNKNINQLQNELSKIKNELLTTAEQNLNESRLRFVCDHIWYFRWLKWRFWLCKCLSWGQRRDKYRAKYEAVRDLLRKAKIYVSDLCRN